MKLQYSIKPFLLCISTFLFVNCLSVPKHSEGATQLLTKVVFINDTGEDRQPFGYIIMKVHGNGEEYTADIPAESTNKFSRFIPPGYYSDWEVYFHYNDGREELLGKPEIPVIIKSDCITIFPFKFIIRHFWPENMSLNAIYMSADIEILSNKDIESMIELFKKDKKFYEWKSLLLASDVLIMDIASEQPEKKEGN